jgi:uncharacterized protein YprB with RNaseH-like and TPR domain
MRTAVLDLETSGFYADKDIILCAVIKEYGKKKEWIVRADKFKSWDTGKSDNKQVVELICEILEGKNDADGAFDIVVMHNGEWFDKQFLNAKCSQYGLRPIMRYKKSVDPCHLSRKHLRMGRNSLAALIDFFNIREKKTPLTLWDWTKAALDSDRKAMDKIVRHCVMDVRSLEMVYNKVRPLIDKINSQGSAY